MKWLLNRLKEKSTWLAIFTLIGILGIELDPELRDNIINAILAVAAVFAFVYKENEPNIINQEVQLQKIELIGESESRTSNSPADTIVQNLVDNDCSHSDRQNDSRMSEYDTLPSDSIHKNGWNG
jgi:hypothetical protein